MGFQMMPITTLYDEYVDRPKLTEQKTPVYHLIPPPPKCGGQQKLAVEK